MRSGPGVAGCLDKTEFQSLRWSGGQEARVERVEKWMGSTKGHGLQRQLSRGLAVGRSGPWLSSNVEPVC